MPRTSTGLPLAAGAAAVLSLAFSAVAHAQLPPLFPTPTPAPTASPSPTPAPTPPPAPPRVVGADGNRVYGGGAQRVSYRSRRQLFGTGNMLIAFKTAGTARSATVRAYLLGGCVSTIFDATVDLSADGSFSASGRKSYRILRGTRRDTVTYQLEGRLTGTTGSGTMAATIVANPRRGATRKCSTGTVSFQVRDAKAAPATNAGATDGFYFGRLMENDEPMLLRVTSGGRRVTNLWFTYRLKCPGGTFAEMNVSPAFSIRSGGLFDFTEHYTVRYRTGVGRIAERYSIRMRGRFRRGRVTGTLRVKTVGRDVRGRKRFTCGASARSFVAAP